MPLTSSAAAQLAAPDIIHRSVEANERDWKAAPSFSHVERDIETKGGVKTDRTYQLFLMDGSLYRRLIAIDGIPLSAARQKQEFARERRELERRRSETPEERKARIDKYQKEREHDHILMVQMERAFDFRLIGEDNLSGHPVYVLDAVPKPDYQPPNREAKVLTGMRGKLWVDKAEFHWAKVEAEVVHTVSFAGFLAKVGPGTKFLFEKEPVRDHVWQPEKFQADVVASILFWSKDSTTVDTFTDYRQDSGVSGLPGLRGPAANVELERKKIE